jgi:tetratricopeptide (TPR) repeat protein
LETVRDRSFLLLNKPRKSADPVLASRAAYNLAVVYEAQGDFDIAIEMAQQSLDKNKNDFAASLLTQLKQELSFFP